MSSIFPWENDSQPKPVRCCTAVPNGIYFYPVDYDKGQISNFSDAKSIVESFKETSKQSIKLKNLNFGQNYGKSFKFKGFY